MISYKGLFESMKEGVLICDQDSNIIYCNKAYLNFINKNFEEIKGKKITEIRKGARQPGVIESGKALVGLVRKEEEEEYFVNIYPIVEDKEVRGGISLVTFLKDAEFIKDGLYEIERRNRYLKEWMRENNGTRYTFDSIVAADEPSIETMKLAKKIAHRDVDVLIQGESGTGKELYAQSIHNESKRGGKPFVAINCSTFPKDLLEAELFGYEQGAFTGAAKGGKTGLFESASGGTIFFDEISEMDLSLQAKLLRVLQEKKIRKIGGREELDIDVRIISACNVDLLKYIAEGKFRKDLYYRIAVIPIEIRPLRERRKDIDSLVDHFLGKMNTRLKKNFILTEGARELLRSYNWPGNIRELKNVLEFSAVMTGDDILDEDSFPPKMFENIEKIKSQDKKVGRSLKERTQDFERKEILKELSGLDDTTKNRQIVAKRLGISLASLYNKLSDSKKIEKQ
ncbi:sigma 54-interacting transcriptional regulator [Peptoniphilus sp. GNH]|nr:sigma 54-interacting transcriptional regulator [Peptoniphilus sp. GNH]